jgi:DNA-directed RNA polymerase specialized sigma24 family protein
MERADISIEGFVTDRTSTREMRVLELDDLLSLLARADERAARVTEMRLFGGMEQEHIASVLGVSRTTVAMDWQFARSWLASRVCGDLSKEQPGERPGA